MENLIESGSITITGLADIEAKLLALGEKIETVFVKQALKASTILMQDGITSRIRDSRRKHKLKVKGQYIDIYPGNLRKHVKIKLVRKMPKGIIRYEVYIKTATAWYAKFIEFGSVHNIPPLKPMRNAFESEKEAAANLFKSALIEAIKAGGF